jgi:hypothetical protein
VADVLAREQRDRVGRRAADGHRAVQAPCTGLGESDGVSTACPDTGPPRSPPGPLTPSRVRAEASKPGLDISGRERARDDRRRGAVGRAVRRGAALRRGHGAPARRRSRRGRRCRLPAVGRGLIISPGAELQLAAELQVARSATDGVRGGARRTRGRHPQLAVVALAAMVGDRLMTQPSAICQA